MYFNSIVFLVTSSRIIKFCIAEVLQNRRVETLLTGLKKVKMLHSRHGFIMNRAAGDNEFATLDVGLSSIGVTLNTVSQNEHVPEIARHIRTLKDRCISTYNALPFNKKPTRIIVELVYAMKFRIHAFPAADGVSASISPRELVSGVAISAKKHSVIPFGAFSQTHEKHNSSMLAKTIGTIALRPTGNAQEGHYFLGLQTGRRIIRNHWTEIPMPGEVVQRVHQLVDSSALNRLRFSDREDEEGKVEDAESEEISSSTDTEYDEPESYEAEPYNGDSDSGKSEDEAMDGSSAEGAINHEGDDALHNVEPEACRVTFKTEEDTEWTPDAEPDAEPYVEKKDEAQDAEDAQQHPEESEDPKKVPEQHHEMDGDVGLDASQANGADQETQNNNAH